MFTHFHWKPLFASESLPGWSFSFFFQKVYYTGIYHKDGGVEWTGPQPPEQYEKQVVSYIHELMLFHVYE
ncbi:YheE family protein [Ectobacillus panaciterrae]|uniref:YheE family protein n=1 Tax=Ectobacillus panaciterrae TaxID=363872 RepID=UPI0004202470|nr:YheE family protein [Ectobacillus panaciterrae]